MMSHTQSVSVSFRVLNQKQQTSRSVITEEMLLEIISSLPSKQTSGVMFSRNLNFDDHVTFVLSICLQRLYLIKLLRSQWMPESKLCVPLVALIISRISYALSASSCFLNSQQRNRINAFFRKARRFGLCSSTCLCDVSEYLRLAESRLFNHIQSNSHCLSHLLPPEKHHLGLCPRGHSYPLHICPNNLCKCSFIPRSLFCFP